jgi:hypothetical protein
MRAPQQSDCNIEQASQTVNRIRAIDVVAADDRLKLKGIWVGTKTELSGLEIEDAIKAVGSTGTRFQQ